MWHERNREFAAPVGEWLTLTYVFIEGDKDTGRLVFKVRRADGSEHTVFDIHNCTHHPDKAQPDGLHSWNPLKLYCHQNTVNWVRENGGLLQVYWDDFEIYANP